ncbi:MAG: YigZ family protein [Alcanivorax sp.]|uniref:YigZ family protein n=1 Tax=Alloalcanivorax marinus TaxID=1177169 RepID=UPI001956C3EE|nr:YigZ family protein [Alloalcanivorax marinus]MBM7333622.1 YigZ family protein [Alloalcanivorax marinus]
MTYPVPAGPVDRELEINKSRFIAWLRPVRSRAEGQAVLEEARARYPDATHHCHAWLIGAPNSGQGAMNDDGEPSGTAGKPIFNVIQHKGIGDVMVVVIRYFGGVKLGAGGLVRAYAGAAEAVLSAMEVIEQVPESTVTLRLGFAQEQPLRHWCDQHEGQLDDVDYGETVRVRLTLPEARLPELDAFCAAQGMDRD